MNNWYENVKVGDILIAIDGCMMEDGIRVLTINNEYEILDVIDDGNTINILNDYFDEHLFSTCTLPVFFKYK